MFSGLLQLAPGSHGPSQTEKRIMLCKAEQTIITQNEDFVHHRQF
jgi:hypothetical protein